jgi:uncharacterized protein (DUF3820 family)
MAKIKKKAKLEHTMPFGKYKGLTFKGIIELDFKYYQWLINEDIIEPNWNLFALAYRYINKYKPEKQLKAELKLLKKEETTNKKNNRLERLENERELRAIKYQIFLKRMNNDIQKDENYKKLKN